MEDAVVHAVDGLSGVPELIFVLGILVILAVVAIKVVPKWGEFKQKKLDNEAEAERIRLENEAEVERLRLANEAKYEEARLQIERERESRKLEEANQRFERDKEMTAIMARSVDAQERSNLVIADSNAQMAILNATLEASQSRSAAMGGKIDGMAVEVHDIHGAIIG